MAYIDDHGPSNASQTVAVIRSDENDSEGDPITLGFLAIDPETGECRWFYVDRPRAPEASAIRATDVEEVAIQVAADEALTEELRELHSKYCSS